MKTFSSILLMIHVAAGFSSLLLFWIPVFTKKGSINHVKVGKLYIWLMWIVVKHKKGLSKTFQRTHLIFESLILVAGVLLLGYGIYLQGEGGAILMIIFGILGVSNLGSVLKLVKTPPQQMDWFMEHMKDMIISGIAAYTAFFAFGGRTLLGEIFTGYWMIVPWVAPTIIGVFTIKYLEKYYAKKKKTKVTRNPVIS